MFRNIYTVVVLFEIFNFGIGQYITGGFTINDNQYTLRWEVYGPMVTFRVIARGTGFVGFGLSPKGSMEDADLFISGIYENGTVYAIDAFGAKGEKDAMNNYMLLYMRQNHMHTEVHFRRAINTGDCKGDIRIMNKPQYIIWSIGPMGDALEHHGKDNRGSVLVNILNPPMFHSYYNTNATMMDPMCMNGGGGGGGGGGGAEAEMKKETEAEEVKPERLVEGKEEIKTFAI